MYSCLVISPSEGAECGSYGSMLSLSLGFENMKGCPIVGSSHCEFRVASTGGSGMAEHSEER